MHIVSIQAQNSGTENIASGLNINLLDDITMDAGIEIEGAIGTITTGLVVSDSQLVNSISIGANNFLGTTANIDLTNFDVIGSSGDVISAGNYRRSVTDSIVTTGDTTRGDEPLTKDINRVITSGAGGDTGPTLPVAAVGMVIVVINDTANNLRLWPNGVTDVISGVAAGTHVLLASQVVNMCFAIQVSPALWYCVRVVREDAS